MAVRLILLIICSLWWATAAFAQKNCGTVAYQDMLKGTSAPEIKNEFEEWMSIKLKEQASGQQLARGSQSQQVITIPIVIHIIHSGEPVGSGSNIHDSRIMEQIDRLNQDFRRLNEDTLNTPPEFLSVAADAEIEFVLAKRDPHGLPTTGINRVVGNRPVYDLVHNTELKALSYWPAEDYMNLWVAQLNNLLGYAQFPEASTLEGLDIASENRLTDGVVIDTDFFGVNSGLTPESIGRTSTHEVGHYLGLRHTWGDGGCSVDDFCEDTPRSNSSNFGCPDSESCGSEDMVENYMDLTDDLCMNLFTICQKNRMRVVMNNSPRRASLINSKGAIPPPMVDNDAAIRDITFPLQNTCSSTISPQATVQNTGTNTITSFIIELRVDDITNQTLQVTTPIDQTEITDVSFSSINVEDQTKIEMIILETNGVTDANPENDRKQVILDQKSFANLPLDETFNSFPADWEIRNDDNSITWEIVNAPAETSLNTAAGINFFSYDNSTGEYDYLVSPALDLTTYTGLNLQFDIAYAPFSPGNQDGLIVAISEDCGNSYPVQNYVFFKEGTELATAQFTAGSFVPSTRNDWRTESINLDQFAGLNNLKIAFIGVNDFGNNLYLDNITISGNRIPDLDLSLESILSPAAVLCPAEVAPRVIVKNTGLNSVDNFKISYQLEMGNNGQLEYAGPPLTAGETVSLEFDPISLDEGLNQITVTIDQVEGGSDGRSTNNVLEQSFLVNNDRDLIPKKEPFEQPIAALDWNQLNPDQEIGWSISQADGTGSPGNQAAFLNFFAYNSPGQLDYLASPVLDFTQAFSATMTFDLAYAANANFNDGLLVLASTDCGVNYTDTLFQAFGQDLATVNGSTEFFPTDAGQWKLHQIDLSGYSGESQVRIAMVGVNDFGNNLFVDNIQFFLSDQTKSLDLAPNQMIAYPNPAAGEFSLTFNLDERADVDLRIIDAMGRVIWSKQLDNVLNQTFEVELPAASGIHILQASSATFSSIRRIILL